MKNKIERLYRDMEPEYEAGFKAGRSTVEYLFAVNQIVEKRHITLKERAGKNLFKHEHQ